MRAGCELAKECIVDCIKQMKEDAEKYGTLYEREDECSCRELPDKNHPCNPMLQERSLNGRVITNIGLFAFCITQHFLY